MTILHRRRALAARSVDSQPYCRDHSDSGFTIVELLVVIVVIGILAAITIVSYTGISQRATVASLQSDLTNASGHLKMYQADHGAFPATLDVSNCPTGPADANYCLKPSSGNTFIYSSSSPYSTFSLVATSVNGTKYSITDSSGPVVSAAVVVTGGTVTTDGAYTVRTFTSSGTLTVTGGTISNAQVLVVGGGGGGCFGGGGAGGLLSGTQALTASMSVTVGVGGAPGKGYDGSYPATNGGNSVFGSRTATGGGRGGNNSDGFPGGSMDKTAGTGGSGGGGGGGSVNTTSGANGSSGQGSAGGGNGSHIGAPYPAGGGGGAGGVGATASSNSVAGTGGAGVNSDIVLAGTNVGYAGGGGGGLYATGGTAGTASHGGGGGASGGAGTAGTAGTGGGGGGAGNTPEGSYGGAGGSGIVIIRYLTPS